MAAFVDITGKRYNSFLVLKRVENKHRKARWLCRCDCGEEVIMYTSDFSPSRSTKMCRSCFMKTFIVHGKTGSKEYKCWQDMKARCDRLSSISFKNYGGRGISYCKKWGKFINFYNDMGDMPSAKHTLERKDVNKGYFKSNCIWATKKEQGRNKRTNVFYTINGVTKCLSEWCEYYNVKYLIAFRRLQAGRDILSALLTPKNGFYRTLTYMGKTMTISEWGKEVGIPSKVLSSRIKYGWSVKDVLTNPRRFIKYK